MKIIQCSRKKNNTKTVAQKLLLDMMHVHVVYILKLNLDTFLNFKSVIVTVASPHSYFKKVCSVLTAGVKHYLIQMALHTK